MVMVGITCNFLGWQMLGNLVRTWGNTCSKIVHTKCSDLCIEFYCIKVLSLDQCIMECTLHSNRLR